MFKKIAKTFTALSTAIAVMFVSCMPVLAAGKHSVTFMYGTKQYVTLVDDGCNALPPSDTYVPGYNFLGWVGNANNVTEDRIILGAYSKVDTPAVPTTPVSSPQSVSSTQTYDVKFVDSLTGNTYYHQTVSAGADANPPEVPHHDGYHFERYDGSYDNVDSDRTITAIYSLDYTDYHDDYNDWWWLYHSTDDQDDYQQYWWL